MNRLLPARRDPNQPAVVEQSHTGRVVWRTQVSSVPGQADGFSIIVLCVPFLAHYWVTKVIFEGRLARFLFDLIVLPGQNKALESVCLATYRT